jgi:hypothetical protein
MRSLICAIVSADMLVGSKPAGIPPTAAAAAPLLAPAATPVLVLGPCAAAPSPGPLTPMLAAICVIRSISAGLMPAIILAAIFI